MNDDNPNYLLIHFKPEVGDEIKFRINKLYLQDLIDHLTQIWFSDIYDNSGNKGERK